jgi:hypothetical protein
MGKPGGKISLVSVNIRKFMEGFKPQLDLGIAGPKQCQPCTTNFCANNGSQFTVTRPSGAFAKSSVASEIKSNAGVTRA